MVTAFSATRGQGLVDLKFKPRSGGPAVDEPVEVELALIPASSWNTCSRAFRPPTGCRSCPAAETEHFEHPATGVPVTVTR